MIDQIFDFLTLSEYVDLCNKHNIYVTDVDDNQIIYAISKQDKLIKIVNSKIADQEDNIEINIFKSLEYLNKFKKLHPLYFIYLLYKNLGLEYDTNNTCKKAYMTDIFDTYSDVISNGKMKVTYRRVFLDTNIFIIMPRLTIGLEGLPFRSIIINNETKTIEFNFGNTNEKITVSFKKENRK